MGQLHARWRKLEASYEIKRSKAEKLALDVNSISGVLTKSNEEEQLVYNKLIEFFKNYSANSEHNMQTR